MSILYGAVSKFYLKRWSIIFRKSMPMFYFLYKLTWYHSNNQIGESTHLMG